MGNTRYFYYDSRGNLRYTLDADGHRTEYGYDGLSRRTWTHQYYDPDNYYRTVMEWDDNSRLAAQEDDNGNRTECYYDCKNRLCQTVHADGTLTILLYDNTSTVAHRIDANLTVSTNYYDSLGRLIQRDIILGPYSSLGQSHEYQNTFQHFVYNALGRVTLAEDNDTRIVMTYDSLGNLLSETQTIGKKRGCKEDPFQNPVIKIVSSRYDGSGNRLKLFYPDGSTVLNYDIDSLNRIEQINLGAIAKYFYMGQALDTPKKNSQTKWTCIFSTTA